MYYIKEFMQECHACGHFRCEIIAREINKRYQDVRMDVKMDMFASDIIGTSLAVFLRMHSQAFFDRMMVIKGRGIKVAFDIDDDMLNIPPECVAMHKLFQDPGFKGRHLKYLQNADVLLVSTNTLAETLRKQVKTPMIVLPNSLDVEEWDMAFAERMARGVTETLTIGWMGSSFHIYDAPVIEDALCQILEEHPNVKVHFIGWINLDNFKMKRLNEFKERFTFNDWIPIDQLPMALSNWDIGLAPLNDWSYNRSRSGVKYMQYGALGMPTVASPNPAYQDVIKPGETGLLAEQNSPKGWYDCIKKLVTDKEYRVAMGMKARKDVLANHDIRNNVKMWHDAYLSIIRT